MLLFRPPFPRRDLLRSYCFYRMLFAFIFAIIFFSLTFPTFALLATAIFGERKSNQKVQAAHSLDLLSQLLPHGLPTRFWDPGTHREALHDASPWCNQSSINSIRRLW